MEIITGSLYFVSDEFFAKIQDPYLKVNYENTKRPYRHNKALENHAGGIAGIFQNVVLT